MENLRVVRAANGWVIDAVMSNGSSSTYVAHNDSEIVEYVETILGTNIPKPPSKPLESGEEGGDL